MIFSAVYPKGITSTQKESAIRPHLYMRYCLEILHRIEREWDKEDMRHNLLKELKEKLEQAQQEGPLSNLLSSLRSSSLKSLKEFLAISIPCERSLAAKLEAPRQGKPKGWEESLGDGRRTLLSKNDKLPVTLILENLRSAHNVGSIIRSCEGFGVEAIHLCGYTCGPEHKEVQKTALSAEQYVPIERYSSTKEAIQALQAKSYQIWGLEVGEKSDSLETSEPKGSTALVLGNERYGIEPETLVLCDKVIEIPLYGYKNSLNVATSAAISVYEISKKLRHLKKNLDFKAQEAD